MRIVPALDHKIRREIRDARAKDPLVSVVDLQEQLEKQFNRTFSRKYIAKLAFRVERQALQDADRTKIEERIQFTRESYRMARERLLKIFYWKPEDGGNPPAQTGPLLLPSLGQFRVGQLFDLPSKRRWHRDVR
jgi:hypothetical protein